MEQTDVSRNPENGYQWRCPYCGKSRVNAADGEQGRQNALSALQNHIYASDGDGHGPRRDHPDDIDEQVFSEYVDRVDSPME